MQSHQTVNTFFEENTNHELWHYHFSYVDELPTKKVINRYFIREMGNCEQRIKT